MFTPSSWSYKLPLNKKWVRDVVNAKSFFTSARLIFKILFFIIRSTPKSMASSSGILANKLQTSNDTRNFFVGVELLDLLHERKRVTYAVFLWYKWSEYRT